MSRLFIYTSGTTTGLVDIDSIHSVEIFRVNGVLASGKRCGIQEYEVRIVKSDFTHQRVYGGTEAQCEAFAKDIKARITSYDQQFASDAALTGTATSGDIKYVLGTKVLTYRNGSSWSALATGN